MVHGPTQSPPPPIYTRVRCRVSSIIHPNHQERQEKQNELIQDILLIKVKVIVRSPINDNNVLFCFRFSRRRSENVPN